MDDIQKTCVAEEDGQIRGGWLLMEYVLVLLHLTGKNFCVLVIV